MKGMSMHYLTDEEIRAELFSLLCEFDEFVGERGYRYTLLGGTLLGAVRHKGFIPWDDDVDVGMPRPDYELFIRSSNQAPNNVVVSTLTEDTPLPFAKFGRRGILCIEKEVPETEHLWVDVFPLDGMPDDEAQWCNQFERIQKQKIRASRRRATYDSRPRWKRALMIPGRKLLSSIEPALSIYRKMDEIAQEVPFGSTVRCRDTIWNPSPTNYFLTEDFDDLISLEFCGRGFPAVKHWDQTLTSMYGDYMTLPPESQRVTHGLKAWYAKEE